MLCLPIAASKDKLDVIRFVDCIHYYTLIVHASQQRHTISTYTLHDTYTPKRVTHTRHSRRRETKHDQHTCRCVRIVQDGSVMLIVSATGRIRLHGKRCNGLWRFRDRYEQTANVVVHSMHQDCVTGHSARLSKI